MNTDKDYVALQDAALMQAYEREYFEIYRYFQDNPEEAIVEEDWQKLDILSDTKRLWYRVGAMMASVIDHRLGREKLVSLIDEPSENFIATYLNLKGP